MQSTTGTIVYEADGSSSSTASRPKPPAPPEPGSPESTYGVMPHACGSACPTSTLTWRSLFACLPGHLAPANWAPQRAGRHPGAQPPHSHGHHHRTGEIERGHGRGDSEALVRITELPREECARRQAVLKLDPGVDSLALLELVETLQRRLAIVVPDEVTIRIRTVADLQDVVAGMVAAALSSAPTPRT
ncbi:hypothetical protein C5746_41975 [Streptomyces atratus]|uniref:Carrier domain-containing protein n=1 Tax=Streptomyces atratus TaxID=1893 RepID=A0A2Z5JPF2_STRAR|nr:hypothetical protein C5746_41975 [Streptomyces atratus]